MIEEKIKHTLTRSYKLILFMIVLIWLNHFSWSLAEQATFSINHPLIFPILASGTALVLITLLYYHSRNINRRLKFIIKGCIAPKTYLTYDLPDNIGHELRTPMIGIMGSVDLLSRSILDTEQMAHLDTIRECGHDLLCIIDTSFKPANLNNNRIFKADSASEPNIKAKASMEIEQNHTLLFNQFLPINVLLVEDNSLNQKLILQMLNSYGFNAASVNNGLECLQILQEKSYHIILMDMQMPVLDGYETTRKIRSNSFYDHIPIIAITANTLNYDYDKCMACGCSAYLPKPFSADELVSKIKLLLKIDYNQKPSISSSDELINQLLPEFIEILAEMLDDLQVAVEQRDMHVIRELSHAIKGTAGMYGFMQISDLAAMIETASRDNCYLQITRLVKQMNQYEQQIINRLNEVFA